MIRNILTALLIAFFAISCESEYEVSNTNFSLEFSEDTVFFDTVFSELSSVTKVLKVYNRNSSIIKISEVKLAKGNQSSFKMNVDGESANSVGDVEIYPNDSLFIFLKVNIEPGGDYLPFVVQDSIIFNMGISMQDIDLLAWGQNANIYKKAIIGSETWDSDLPYLVYDYLFVDTNEVLTITPGTKVYFHDNARLYVAGKIEAKGTLDEPVLFTSDRLDEDYIDIPGQWQGIWILPGSSQNSFEYTEIYNAINGIWVDTLVGNDYTLTLSKTKIMHMASSALYAQGARVIADNSVFANCGKYAVALTIGGEYEFYHCTIANYWPLFYSNRYTPSLYISNYYIDINQQVQARSINKAYFGNSIIYGNNQEEVELDYIYQSEEVEAELNYHFDYCAVRGSTIPEVKEGRVNNVIYDRIDFISYAEYDFQLDTLSPAKDAGNAIITGGFHIDLNGNNRLQDNAPDLGAFERIENEPEK